MSASPEFESVVKSNVRYRILIVCFVIAFLLYLDRVCLGEIVKTQQFLSDTGLSKEQIGQFLGAFFFSYALFQVPAGWLSDRFGARLMLTIYVVAWSLCTLLTGVVGTFAGLMVARIGFGIAQAGAYPTMSATVRRWYRFSRRGQASSLVSFGGRLGGTLAPFLTAMLIIALTGWRETLWLYGIVGLGTAIAYRWIIRDTPALHPKCNLLEQEHIGFPEDTRKPELREILPMLKTCCLSLSLWLNSMGQFFINVGWAFLITWLPTFLKDRGVDNTQGAMMVTVVLAMGMVGQPIGGWATDASVRRFGLRIGRVLPICLASFVAGCSYIACAYLDSLWGVVACCAVVSLMTDIGNPSTWAFMQDVGGRNTAAIFGWANMWGNFGAALSAIMVPQLMNYGSKSGSGETLVFLACAAAFFIAGLAAMGMDATKPIGAIEPSRVEA
ncbi:MFS transporter [uncultured Rubinisphaera sp.]|uniref:MFS transporter n=1 Tax=uncultured Rubinisphaera sp. TaxID=1678686 RepID=UPI000EDB25AC|nr:hypothetical protein [Planctomycetaceae bacterium]|tara:strand:- start:334 stop:1659 length:1326 start_codon:yes stop_codon:yes gene_type:complete